MRKGSQNDYRDCRVVQKNLVYIIGIAPELAREELLEDRAYLGQYGTIEKLVVKNTPFKNEKGASYSAYVTFDCEAAAALCIAAISDYSVYGRTLKASFGTTKYCRYFLQGERCRNQKQCSFLHEFCASERTRDDSLH
jgi:hypothetical protein